MKSNFQNIKKTPVENSKIANEMKEKLDSNIPSSFVCFHINLISNKNFRVQELFFIFS